MKFKPKYLIFALGLMSSGCNTIAEDDRYIEVEATKAARTVLLEDFTGQNCVNCPAAHRTIEELEQQYGSHIIAVSIHAGHFGIPATNKRYTGLMQDDGQIFNDRYGIEGYPQGVVDGQMPPLNPDLWATAVYNEISEKTPLTIELEAVYDASTKQIATNCSLVSSEALDGTLYVWVTESSIVARQEDLNEGRINDYVHNNVFRACVNSVDGQSVALAANKAQSLSFTTPLKETETETWNPANLSIVAFVKNSGGVVQAAKTNVN